MPTLAAPILDSGGLNTRTARSRVNPGVVLVAFVGAAAVTAVCLRLVLGPVSTGDGGTGTAARTTSERPALRTASTSEGVEKPSTEVERSAGVQRDPAVLAHQFIREYLTVTPGESPRRVAARVEALVVPGFRAQLVSEAVTKDRPGSLVEMGAVTEIEAGVFDVTVWPWVYQPAEEARRLVRQVWRVEVSKGFGSWFVTGARQV